RGPALLPDVPRDERGGGDGDDRARLRRAHRQGAADGVRPRAQPPHRTPDGRSRWLMSLLAVTSSREAHTHSAETMVPDASRGERTRSWEVADFPVPTGREEDWRFTPVNRLTDLFAEDGTTGELQVEHVLPKGVTRTTLPKEEWRAGAQAPADRAAVVAAAGSEEVTVLDIPAEAELTEPVRIRLSGQGG